MITKVLLIICASLLLGATAIGQVESTVHGSWEWVSTSYSSGIVDTPATTGRTQQLEFNSDHRYRQYDDGILTREDIWRWTCSYESIGSSWRIDNLIYIGNDQALHEWSTNSSNLSLGNAKPWWNPSIVDNYSRRTTVATEPSSWSSVKSLYR